MSNKCKFVGRVVYVGPTEELGKTEKKFYKRQIIVDDAEVGAKWPNEVAFESTGDKCQYLDGYKEGDVVTIEFYPCGRRWKNPKTGKDSWFTSNRIGFISKGEDAGDATEAEEMPESVDDVDQMPF